MMESGADGTGIVTMRYPDKLVTLTYSSWDRPAPTVDFRERTAPFPWNLFPE